jgi:hypothetical protein
VHVSRHGCAHQERSCATWCYREAVYSFSRSCLVAATVGYSSSRCCPPLAPASTLTEMKWQARDSMQQQVSLRQPCLMQGPQPVARHDCLLSKILSGVCISGIYSHDSAVQQLERPQSHSSCTAFWQENTSRLRNEAPNVYANCGCLS